jgi:hypothetical protein
MIKVCMVLKKEWLLANYWGWGTAAPPPFPGAMVRLYFTIYYFPKIVLACVYLPTSRLSSWAIEDFYEYFCCYEYLFACRLTYNAKLKLSIIVNKGDQRCIILPAWTVIKVDAFLLIHQRRSILFSRWKLLKSTRMINFLYQEELRKWFRKETNCVSKEKRMSSYHCVKTLYRRFARYVCETLYRRFAGPLTHIFSESFTSRLFPDKWKISKVCGIPKCMLFSGSSEINRTKVRESYATEWIYEDVWDKISTSQFGGLRTRNIFIH